jgi:hypothetical protein
VQDLDTKLFLKLTDIDYTCVKMAFVNMSIMGLSARIILGDALTNNENMVFDTPAMQLAMGLGLFRNAEMLVEPTKNNEKRPCTQLTLF